MNTIGLLALYLAGIILCIYFILVIFRQYNISPNINFFEKASIYGRLIKDAIGLSFLLVFTEILIKKFLNTLL
jgi:hypothetical protein